MNKPKDNYIKNTRNTVLKNRYEDHVCLCPSLLFVVRVNYCNGAAVIA